VAGVLLPLDLVAALPQSVTSFTLRVSQASGGTPPEAIGASGLADIFLDVSADGAHVAFNSNATNLVAGDANGQTDAFVSDWQTHTTTRVSVASDGSEADKGGGYGGVFLSGDGHYVAFDSLATNLAPGGNASNLDFVYRHNLQAPFETTRVSVSKAGVAASSHSYRPCMSADGRWVAFKSIAPNLLTSGTAPTTYQVFLKDMTLGDVYPISVNDAGDWATGESAPAGISSDGNLVAFASAGTNLGGGSQIQVYLRNRTTGHTTCISTRDGSTTPGNSESDGYVRSLSADGRYLAFASQATDLVAGKATAQYDVYRRDLTTNSTILVSRGSDGTPGNAPSYGPASVSADGRYVAFNSSATNLADGGTNGSRQVFVHDCLIDPGVTSVVSVSNGGIQANGDSWGSSLSGDGHTCAFYSDATDLVSGDTNGVRDAFLRSRSSGTVVGDFDGDGIVALPDLIHFRAEWVKAHTAQAWDPACDLNGDTKLDEKDAVILLDNYLGH
jgi:hypothetical protein